MENYMYKTAYYGYEGSWHHFVTHTIKYTKEEFQCLMDCILDNYELLIALEILKANNANFIEFMENIFSIYGENLKDRTFMFESYEREVLEILTDLYGFERYEVKVEAEAF